MRLTQLNLQDFRNVPAASLSLCGDRIFLVGTNGQGKTNFLEAAGFITAIRAFRSADSRVLIRQGCSEAVLAYRLEHEREGESAVTVRIRFGAKDVQVDGETVKRLADVLGRFPTVLFASDDIQLIRGSPGLRRRLLDLHLSSIDPDYLRALQRYHRALQERNALLKAESDASELAAFEGPLVESAAIVYQKRCDGLVALSAEVCGFYDQLCDGSEKPGLQYKPDVEASSPEALAAMLRRTIARDRVLKSTQRGPHRDDFQFSLNANPALTFASEGQQRGLVLALRFAQLALVRKHSGVRPIVLADDVLGELDPVRRKRFWEALDPACQIIATGTELPAGDPGGWQVFRVQEGTFEAAAV